MMEARLVVICLMICYDRDVLHYTWCCTMTCSMLDGNTHGDYILGLRYCLQNSITTGSLVMAMSFIHVPFSVLSRCCP